MKRKMCAVVAVLAAAWLCAVGEVVDSSANGFTYKTSLTIQAPPAAVYQHFLEVGNWWNSSHTFSGDAKNLSIDVFW